MVFKQLEWKLTHSPKILWMLVLDMLHIHYSINMISILVRIFSTCPWAKTCETEMWNKRSQLYLLLNDSGPAWQGEFYCTFIGVLLMFISCLQDSSEGAIKFPISFPLCSSILAQHPALGIQPESIFHCQFTVNLNSGEPCFHILLTAFFYSPEHLVNTLPFSWLVMWNGLGICCLLIALTKDDHGKLYPSLRYAQTLWQIEYQSLISTKWDPSNIHEQHEVGFL